MLRRQSQTGELASERLNRFRKGNSYIGIRKESKTDGRVVALVVAITIISIVALASVSSYWLSLQVHGKSSTPDSSPASVGFVGKPVFTILEGNNYTVKTTPSPINSDVVLNRLTLNAPNSTTIRIDLFDHDNGTLTIPAGALINVTVGSRSYQINDPNFPPNLTNPLITVPPGNTPIRYTVVIPPDAHPGTYKFSFEIYSFRDSSATFTTWGNYFTVNLIVT